MFKIFRKNARLTNLTEVFTTKGLPFSELKPAYDFLTLHLSKIEEATINDNRRLKDNEEYIKMKATQEKIYNLMLERIKTPIWSDIAD